MNYTTTNGTATSATDYTAVSGGSVTFPVDSGANQTAAVSITNDVIDELLEDEVFTVQFAGSNFSGSDTFTVTIQDDDDEPVITIADLTVADGDAGSVAHGVSVTMAGLSDQAVTVDYASSSAAAVYSATAGTDYEAIPLSTLTWAAGTDGVMTIPITITGDTVYENNETFEINLSNNLYSTMTDTLGIVTITENETAPTVSITDVSVTEGDSLSSIVTITATLSNDTFETVSATYATVDGSATTADTDYVATGGTLNWVGGVAGDQTMTVVVNGDDTYELDESFNVLLSGVSGGEATPTTLTSTITITNDETVPTVTIDSVTVNEAAGTATVTATLSLDTFETVIVSYATSDGTAVAGSDYTAATGTLNWTSGLSGTQTFVVSIAPDTRYEPTSEAFTVTLSSLSGGGAVMGVDTGIVTITDDDSAPTVSVVGDVSISEGGGNAEIGVSLSNDTYETVTVSSYGFTDGTAVAGSDYTSSVTPVTWVNGDSGLMTITVPILNDGIYELTEVFTVTLLTASGGGSSLGAPTSGVVTINNDEATPTVSITSQSAEEGNTAIVNLSLSVPTYQDVTVDYETIDGTAQSGDNDYSGLSASFTWTAGDNTTQSIAVNTTEDAVNEADETIELLLDNLSGGGAIFSGMGITLTGVITIENDDAIPAIVIGDVTVSELDTVTVTVNLPVTMTGSSSSIVTIPYTMTNGTAIGGSDYLSETGTVSWPALTPGLMMIGIDVFGDYFDEGTAETFNVHIGSPIVGNATLTNTTGIVTITDNDTADVTVSPMSSTSMAEAGGSATFSVVLTSEPLGSVTVPITSTVGECTLDGGVNSTSLTFTSGDWSVAQTVTVTAVDDTIDFDHTCNIGLDTVTAPSDGATYGGDDPPDRSVSITDDDTAGITFTVDPSIDEDGTGTFTATLDTTALDNVTFSLTPNSECTTAGSITILSGSTFETGTITGTVDAVVDGTVSCSIITGSATSGGDDGYNGLTVSNFAVDVNDTTGSFTGSIASSSVVSMTTVPYTITVDTSVSATFGITVGTAGTSSCTIASATSGGALSTRNGEFEAGSATNEFYVITTGNTTGTCIIQITAITGSGDPNYMILSAPPTTLPISLSTIAITATP